MAWEWEWSGDLWLFIHSTVNVLAGTHFPKTLNIQSPGRSWAPVLVLISWIIPTSILAPLAMTIQWNEWTLMKVAQYLGEWFKKSGLQPINLLWKFKKVSVGVLHIPQFWTQVHLVYCHSIVSLCSFLSVSLHCWKKRLYWQGLSTTGLGFAAGKKNIDVWPENSLYLGPYFDKMCRVLGVATDLCMQGHY